MSSSEIEVVAKQLDMEPLQVLLQDFDTELDFCNKIRFDHGMACLCYDYCFIH